MKQLFFAVMLLLPFGLFADTLKEGTTIQAPVIKDQFEKTVDITPQTKQIIIAYTKAQGDLLKSFLEANPNYLSENSALYLMDATAVPSMVMSMFMLPKFKKYSYAIGLLENEKDVAYFPKKEDQITIITLNNLNVTAIDFKDKL
ncbi:hypothetical protein FA592_06335 [Sulfurospirillum diekertiae]|uniref:Uncharacterized protein n=1 Tax=Sulfurospirillum diekertiae TaxID=1854492 RepID=A0A1Y0HPB2_9BACT|nr:hypothetical protein [Sulfurospirillum diekertiae]ARU49948.1 hypothetical protein Sdiek1_2805 [Sulfurospirillum diekertiae]ASC94736.1 hypothetical protein Sdiek2_2739 [Sulfurospirillum diekertiae]QIR75870.1 hypothetical protein FA584_06465 [Sulfurospirillum diekertiae]QIR78509.1 hypothetical protein FA592_06335 [Sulfurospirillum diekertiae]